MFSLKRVDGRFFLESNANIIEALKEALLDGRIDLKAKERFLIRGMHGHSLIREMDRRFEVGFSSR